MKRLIKEIAPILLIIAGILGLVLATSIFASCKQAECIPVQVPVETIKQVYVDKLVHDSISERDSVSIKKKGDTILVKEFKYKYKYRLIRDSIQNTDTVVKLVLQPSDVKEVITYKHDVFWWSGLVSMLLIFGFVVYKLTKFFKG